MSGLNRRRLLWLALLGAATVSVVSAYFVWAEAWHRVNYLSGWLLLGVMTILTAYNGRKKLPFLRLGRSESWLEFHIYAGFFSVVLFLLHLRFRVPSGWFEGSLAVLFLLVTLSGVVGLVFSRGLPARLTARGHEVIFEEIPNLRRKLRERAEGLALGSVAATRSATIAEFYARRLHPFLRRPRNFLAHLMEVRLPLARRLQQLSDLNRYLNEEERAVSDQLAEIIRQKDALDYHHALQLTLKLWLFVHIPLTYGLMLFSVAHVVLVYGFSGGVR